VLASFLPSRVFAVRLAAGRTRGVESNADVDERIAFPVQSYFLGRGGVGSRGRSGSQ